MLGDSRNLDFRDDCFDIILRVSTIEHVQMDNAMYLRSKDMPQTEDTGEFLLAVQEMKSVLEPGGARYVRFPFDDQENHGWFQ